MNLKKIIGKLRNLAKYTAVGVLGIVFGQLPAAAQTNERVRTLGDPFQSVFSLTGLSSQWWVAQYDHPEAWFKTAWRETSVEFDASGITLSLMPTDKQNLVLGSAIAEDDGTMIAAGLTSKAFISGQVQRRKWYGYGRYEVVMQPASGDGLISAFYLYTGPYFGDTHEEVDIEFLGRDTNKVQLNRYRNGTPLEDPVWIDLGFDASEKPHIYAFDWSANSLIWYAGETELFRITGATEVPIPPAKIYLDLWAGGPGQTAWAGVTSENATGQAFVQCISYAPPSGGTQQCSDLVNAD